ncbi:hypothetical protein CCACVL1_09046 [Corchorus capsularis]|uniref:Uncharacterized protein n=1 Tax=Corchorus capsularis TaxID=210143 RepID=A0A1R3IXX7_COCAP|nr:hypothetical protein CCACVL1_09046 [Corchorus capsularis]
MISSEETEVFLEKIAGELKFGAAKVTTANRYEVGGSGQS